ncbi:MAG: hypothetical protein LH619_02855 [Chitinophagaceae bacterium]|nr:hypothetical protein [Chitinophagaceae bacterium]
MKKIAAILLLLILVFNWFGYRFVMNWIQQKADTKLEAKFDSNDYNEAALIEMKVPLDLPYQTDWKDFERCDGEITVDGQHYKYVKRKVQDGMLVVKCIANENKHRIESARDQFFQLANDLQSTDGAKKSDTPKHSVTKNNITECEEFYISGMTKKAVAVSMQKINSPENFIVTGSHNSPEQPPEA